MLRILIAFHERNHHHTLTNHDNVMPPKTSQIVTIRQRETPRFTFSTGRVMKAVTMAAARRKRKETRKRADQETAIDDSRRRHGRHSSASSPSIELPAFRALNPPTFARSTPPSLASPFFFGV